VPKDAVTPGRSAFVNETCPSKKSHHQYLDVAAALSMPARRVCFHLERALCDHLHRCWHVVTKRSRTVVPAIACNMFEKNFEAPNAREEGFVQV